MPSHLGCHLGDQCPPPASSLDVPTDPPTSQTGERVSLLPPRVSQPMSPGCRLSARVQASTPPLWTLLSCPLLPATRDVLRAARATIGQRLHTQVPEGLRLSRHAETQGLSGWREPETTHPPPANSATWKCRPRGTGFINEAPFGFSHETVPVVQDCPSLLGVKEHRAAGQVQLESDHLYSA